MKPSNVMNVMNIKTYHNAITNTITAAKPHSHCNFCGNKYSTNGEQLKWPRDCEECHSVTYLNPIPVGVGIVRIAYEKRGSPNGFLLVKRGINPFVGGLSFPGGFVNSGETWQNAISREILEEISLQTCPSEFALVGAYSTPDATRILMFGLSEKIYHASQIDWDFVTKETSSVLVSNSKTKLCFSIHQDVLDSVKHLVSSVNRE
jgi:ADP-ribose pyrophosphatase YjhB (NUDIX family)